MYNPPRQEDESYTYKLQFRGEKDLRCEVSRLLNSRCKIPPTPYHLIDQQVFRVSIRIASCFMVLKARGNFQLVTFVGLASTKARRIFVFRLIIEYSSLRDFYRPPR
jgi:hypothetical protein